MHHLEFDERKEQMRGRISVCKCCEGGAMGILKIEISRSLIRLTYDDSVIVIDENEKRIRDFHPIF